MQVALVIVAGANPCCKCLSEIRGYRYPSSLRIVQTHHAGFCFGGKRLALLEQLPGEGETDFRRAWRRIPEFKVLYALIELRRRLGLTARLPNAVALQRRALWHDEPGCSGLSCRDCALAQRLPVDAGAARPRSCESSFVSELSTILWGAACARAGELVCTQACAHETFYPKSLQGPRSGAGLDFRGSGALPRRVLWRHCGHTLSSKPIT